MIPGQIRILLGLLVILFTYQLPSQNTIYSLQNNSPASIKTSVELLDHSILIGGWIQMGDAKYIGFIAKVNADGQWLWGKKIKDVNSYSGINKIIPLSDGQFLAGGEFSPNEQGFFQLHLVKFDTNGKFTWNKIVGHSSHRLTLTNLMEKNAQIHIVGIQDDTRGLITQIRLNGELVNKNLLSFYTVDNQVSPQFISMTTQGLMISGNLYKESSSHDIFFTEVLDNLFLSKYYFTSGVKDDVTEFVTAMNDQVYLGINWNVSEPGGIIKTDLKGKIQWSFFSDLSYLRGISGGNNGSVLFMDYAGGFYRLNQQGIFEKGLNFFNTGSIDLFNYTSLGNGYHHLLGSRQTTVGTTELLIIKVHENLNGFCNSYAPRLSPLNRDIQLMENTWSMAKDITLTTSNAPVSWENFSWTVNLECQTTADEVDAPDHSISVYPNPVYSHFYLDLPAGLPYAQATLVDLAGHCRQLQKLTGPHNKISMGQEYTPGIYFLQITDGHSSKVYRLLKI